MKRIVILGGGTGGTLIANRLRRAYDEQAAEIVVVDHDDHHVYQPGLLFVPFGLTTMGRIARPRQRQLRPGIAFRQAGIDRVDVAADRVHLADGTAVDYDVLVVATGARLLPEETDGLTGPRWMQDVFTFYTPEGAVALPHPRAAFGGGRLVVNVVDMPIKCPVAPLEFCFLADHYFRRRGIRDRVELTYVTPLDGAFTKPSFARPLLIDFNYDTEPLTGHYPARLGLPLLRQSRVNHLGKLAFQQFYWHSLLPGRDIPGISSAMPARGKSRPRVPNAAPAATGGHR